MRRSGLGFRGKLTLLVVATSGVALGLASAAFVTHDLFAVRAVIVQALQVHADHIAHACSAALRFGDRETAEEVLSVMAHDPRVVGAAVLDESGRVFASYGRGGARPVPPGGGKPGHRFDRAGVELVQDILLGEERLGRVYLRRDMDDVAVRLRYDATVLGVVFVGSLGLALAGTGWLQRMLIRPVRELAQTVDAVTARRDYTLQAKKLSNDELGVLTDQFNSMLGEVRRRDEELRQVQAQLEQRVDERTRELQQRTEELERFNRAAVGRELRMIELKRQVNDLAREAGKPPVYAVEEPDSGSGV